MIGTAPLRVGGVAATELASAYGTPLVALDTDVFDAEVARLARTARDCGADVCYAGKALLFVALAQRLAQSPLGLDVCSLGELLTAERAGFPPARLVLHGCGKTEAELEAAIAGRVGRLVIDNADELERIAARTRAGRTLDVLLRLNSGVESSTHAAVKTAGEATKFGFSPDAIVAAGVAVMATPGLRLAGVHVHNGSQIFEGDVFEAGMFAALEIYARLGAAGAPLGHLIAGGGFGVGPAPEGARLDPSAVLASLAGKLARACAERRLAPPILGIEPGRALVAAAGTTLYGVQAVKGDGARRFVIVDGGLADNPRPALYAAYHHPVPAGRAHAALSEPATVCGRSCENDELVTAPLPRDLRAGDLLALQTTGAYTFSMASNYNRFPRPAVALAGGGRHRLAVRRESSGEILRNDVDE